jgi:uncharacterized protein YndB with AHSA1/START domain
MKPKGFLYLQRKGCIMAEKSFRLSIHDGSFFKAGDTVGVYFERILDHPVSQVWSALTEPEHLAKWLAPAVIRGGKGGTISLRLTGRVMGGKITEWREETLLEYVWSPAGPSSLCLNDPSMRWELLSEGKDRTRLVFTHRHVPGSQLVDAAKGWHYHLDMLEAALGGQPMPHNVVELWDEITREATARYHAAARLIAPGALAAPFGPMPKPNLTRFSNFLRDWPVRLASPGVLR